MEASNDRCSAAGTHVPVGGNGMLGRTVLFGPCEYDRQNGAYGLILIGKSVGLNEKAFGVSEGGTGAP